MTWQDIQDTLKTEIARISGGASVYWENTTSQWQENHRVLLSLGNIRKIGYDQTKYRFDEANQILVEGIYGQRVLTVLVKVETRNQNLIYASSATAEKIRTRLRRTSTIDTLREDASLSMSTITPIRVVDRKEANTDRIVSYAFFEINFNLAIFDEEPIDVGGTSWIETADINDVKYQIFPHEFETGLITQNGWALITQDNQVLAPQDI